MKSHRRRMKKHKTLKNNRNSNKNSLNRKSSHSKTNQKRKSHRRRHSGMRGGVALVEPYTQSSANSLSSGVIEYSFNLYEFDFIPTCFSNIVAP